MRALTIAVISVVCGPAAWAFGQEAPAGDQAQPATGEALRPVPATDVAKPAGPSAEPKTPEAVPPKKTAVKFPYEGVIVGTNVNVRSGNGTNYYPVTRLNTGHRVTVLGAEYGWVRIAPPAGCYSLVDMKFVDPGENNIGTVNADNVRVRAGSELSSKKYAVQAEAQLGRGAKVTILGEDADAGFYKIKPPEGAALWVHGDYVKPATKADAPTRRSAVHSKTAANARAKVPTTRRASAPAVPRATPTDEPQHRSLRHLPPGPARDELARIEAALARERTKPVDLQDLTPMAERLEQVAAGTDDTIAKIYARQRAKQLRNWMILVSDIRSVRKSSDDLMSSRKPWVVQPRPAPVSEQFDVEGELRVSTVFTSKALPRRYRLVDPTRRPARTVAYLELPPESRVDIARYVGEYVRVRAADRTQLATAGRSIPVIVPAEIVVYTSSDNGAASESSPAAEPTITETAGPVKKKSKSE